MERDAPAGGPVEWARRWVRQARERTTHDRYDAYPDHAEPFDGWGVPPPVLEPVAPPGDAVDAVQARLPVPSGRKIRLMVMSEHVARVVPLPAPWTWLGLIDQRLLGAHVLSEIRRVVLEVIEAEDARQRKDEEGQGLTEYALILALVVVVAIVVLTLLGTQVSSVIHDVGCALPPGCP